MLRGLPKLEHARVAQTELMRESFRRNEEMHDLLRRQEELQEQLVEEAKVREQLAMELHRAEGEWGVRLGHFVGCGSVAGGALWGGVGGSKTFITAMLHTLT